MTVERRVSAVLWTASAGFELACIYAWATFTLTLAHDRPYSLVQAAAAFGCGSLLAGWMRRSGLQGMERALLHSLGLLVLTASALRSTLVELVSLKQWLAGIIVLGWTCVLWFVGARHGRQDLSYERLCRRFDRAVGWLAELFVVKILFRLQPGMNLADGIAGAHVAAFFSFAVVALASARSRSDAHKSFVGQSRGLGPLLGLGLGICLCALALLLLFLPQLRAAAQAALGSLAPLAGPLGSLFRVVVAALFMLCRFLMGPGFAQSPAKKHYDETIEGQRENLDKISFQAAPSADFWLWLTAAVLGVVLLCSLSWIIRRHLRGMGTAMPWYAALLRRWQRLWRQLVLVARDDWHDAPRLYAELQAWGRRSGVAARPHETALEYSARLRHHLPSASVEIDSIVSAFNLHLYAPASQPLLTLSLEKGALRRLRSPRLWPRRFRLWLLGTGDVVYTPHGLGELAVSSPDDAA